jgi:hypothetical protein
MLATKSLVTLRVAATSLIPIRTTQGLILAGINNLEKTAGHLAGAVDRQREPHDSFHKASGRVRDFKAIPAGHRAALRGCHDTKRQTAHQANLMGGWRVERQRHQAGGANQELD